MIPIYSSFVPQKGLRDCVSELVGQGKEVVLVSHSYTGMPAAEALFGLGKEDHERKGLLGGVVRMVLIMAFVRPEGFQPVS